MWISRKVAFRRRIPTAYFPIGTSRRGKTGIRA
jgi:hypothetical protein